MSLDSSPDYLLRPEDKAFKMLFPSMDESAHDAFGDFFDKELYDFSSNDDNDKDNTNNDDIFGMNYLRSPTPSKVPIVQDAPPQPWRKGPWCLNFKPTSEIVVEKTRKTNRVKQEFVSPILLESSGEFKHRNPTSPAKMMTKTVPISSNPKPAALNNERPHPSAVLRDKTLSPSPMYSTLPLRDGMDLQNGWQQDFQKFHLQMPDNGIYLSPQDVKKPNKQELALRQANAKIVARNATISHNRQSPTKYHYPFNHVPRQENGYSEMVSVEAPLPDTSIGISQTNMEQLYHATYSNAAVDLHPGPVWTTESLHSSDSSQNSHGSQYSNECHPYMTSNAIPQLWMPGKPNTTMLVSGDSNPSHIVAPVPQRGYHQVLYQQQEQFPAGLGIQYTNIEEIGRAVSHIPVNTDTDGTFAPSTPPLQTTFLAYPPLPPYPSHVFEDESPFTTPHRHRTVDSRSPSPSISPTRRSVSRGMNQRSPTRIEYSQSRRKSIHKAGPIKDSSQSETQRRTRSSSRPTRTPKTPRTPGGGVLGQVDFVNYTPKDSAKLMSDVAPSGSSKTRMRREQEAREKRKRLSEAAFQAVRRAGGDVKALKDAILA